MYRIALKRNEHSVLIIFRTAAGTVGSIIIAAVVTAVVVTAA